MLTRVIAAAAHARPIVLTNKPIRAFFMVEDVPDLGPHLRLLRIGPGDGPRHRFAFGLLAMDPADLAVPLQMGVLG